jgi:hypothetical protein
MYIINECTNNSIIDHNASIENFDDTRVVSEDQISQTGFKPKMHERTKKFEIVNSIKIAKESLSDKTLTQEVKTVIKLNLNSLESALKRQEHKETVLIDYSPSSYRSKVTKVSKSVPKKVSKIIEQKPKVVKKTKVTELPTHTQKGQKIVRAIFPKKLGKFHA